tara:strand:+ start:2485 stop:2820 length:336 start_codon:yes stop_codon:yes gene_type:complete
MNNKDFIVVTAISTHKMRFVIHKDELQKMNEDITLTDDIAFEWAKDSVTMNEVKEFSQEWLGETIIDVDVKTESEMIELFDRENDYLKSWSLEQKINWVKDWKENSDDYDA